MKIKEILEVCSGKLICGDLEEEIFSYSIDTRTLKENDLFIGIKGDNFDGNDYYLEAFIKGAKAVIIEDKNKIIKKEKNIILVKNSIKALQDIAAYYKEKKQVKVIGITGSVGKTTTKEMIYNLIKDDYSVLKTEGNLNGQIGLPLTVLKLKEEEILLVEMGMNEKGGMDKLAKIVKPDILVITNIGTSHIGKLGSKKKILKAKLEALNYTKNGTVILNNDDELLRKIKLYNHKIITYGINNNSNYKMSILNNNTYKINNEKYKISLLGKGNQYNFLASITVADLLNIKNSKNKIKKLKINNNRLELKEINGIKIIDDTYNASYESIRNAIDVLKRMECDRKVVVLGDILELGRYSKKIHKKIGSMIRNIDVIITVGKNSKYINKKTKIKNYHFKSNEETLIFLKSFIEKNDAILFKASHSMNFKYLVDNIVKS